FGRSLICGKLLEVPPVGPWRSWERASMASRRSWVRIPSAPPRFLGPTRRHGLQNVPATWVTLLGRTRCQAAPPFVPAVQLHRLLWPRPKLQVGGQKKGREFSTERLRFQALLRVFAWLTSPSF